MDFKLTNEQRDIQSAAREFAEKEFPEVGAECDAQNRFPEEIWKKAGELGFVGSTIPEEHGGPGLGFLEQALILEQFWRVDPGISQALINCSFGSELLWWFGTEEQKEKYLPGVAESSKKMGMATTEPEAGSDVSNVGTRAEKDGDSYVINGNKVMIGNATIADFIIILCKTDPDAERHKKWSFLIVETDTPGYDVTHAEKMGTRAGDLGDIFLSDCRVPESQLLGGKEGQGFYQLMKFFDHSRAYVAAHGLGLAQGAMEQAVRHVKKRVAFGQPLAAFQDVQFTLAEMDTKIETARNLIYKACWNLDQGNVDKRLVAMAKWYAARIGVEVVDEALQLHGGYGYLKDYPIERFYRDAKVIEIYEGTKAVEKLILSREVLSRY
ncbi:MAG: acyl-CoA dehydrogenase family protein [Desulfobacteraceae bacterium]